MPFKIFQIRVTAVGNVEEPIMKGQRKTGNKSRKEEATATSRRVILVLNVPTRGFFFLKSIALFSSLYGSSGMGRGAIAFSDLLTEPRVFGKVFQMGKRAHSL